MDTTGCPPGFAADHIISRAPGCEVDLRFFASFVAISLLFRCGLTLLQIRIALFLQRRRKSSAAGGLSTDAASRGWFSSMIDFLPPRLQLTTTFEAIHTMIAVTFFILYGLGLVGVTNSLGIPGVAFVCLPFYAAFFLACLKLVHLGKKIIPRGLRTTFASKLGEKNRLEGDSLSSVQADRVLMFLFTGLGLATLIWAVFFVIVEVTASSPPTNLWIQIGFAAMSFGDICGTLIVFWQTRRVVTFLEKSMEEIKKYRSEGETRSSPLKRTVTMFKIRVLGHLICLAPGIIGKILNAVGIPFGWRFALILLWSSGLCSLFTTLAYIPRGFIVIPCSFRSGRGQTGSKKASSQVHVQASTPSAATPGKGTESGTQSAPRQFVEDGAVGIFQRTNIVELNEKGERSGAETTGKPNTTKFSLAENAEAGEP